MCLHSTHFPNELETIITKSMQVQVEKFSIVISHCLFLKFYHIKSCRFIDIHE